MDTLHGLGDIRRLEETEVHVHLMAQPLGQMPYLRADMKGNQERRARPQHPMDLPECPAQPGRLKMDDRVERDGSRELTVGRRKPEEIALTELHLRIVPAAGGDHGRRQVDTDRGYATAGEPGCHMPRAAPEIGDRRTVFSLLGKAGQQSPVERLSCELVAEALQVLLGDSVITLADSVVL